MGRRAVTARIRLTRLFLITCGVLALWASGAAPAWAHAVVIATTPSNGAEVGAAVTEVRVTFDEAVTLPGDHAAGVIDSHGTEVGNGMVRLVDGGHTLVIGLRPGLSRDVYIASWSVVSDDSHPVGGSIQFGYGVPASAIALPQPPRPSSTLELVVAATKTVVYLGLVAALGLIPAAAVLGAGAGERRVLWRCARIGAVVVVFASLGQIVVQYLWDASAVPGGASWSGLRDFAGTRYGDTILVRVCLLALAALVLPGWRRAWRGDAMTTARWVVVGLLGVGVLGAVVRNGHGGGGTWWYFATTVAHVLAAVVWLGGLAVLGWLLLRRRLWPSRIRRLPRWSAYAGVAVGVVAAAGVVQSVTQVGYPRALLGTTYGRLLIVKILLVVAAVGIAVLARRVTRNIAGHLLRTRVVTPGATARLRGRVRAEAAVGVIVVLASGVLSSVTPAADAYAPTRSLPITVGPYQVAVTVGPARRGPQSFRISAVGDVAVTPVVAVELALADADGAVRSLAVDFPYRIPSVLRPGCATTMTFVSTSVNIPRTGHWTGTLTVIAGPRLQYVSDFRYLVE